MKLKTNQKRSEQRKEAKEKADKLYEEGKFDEAKKMYTQCVRIDNTHKNALIQHLKEVGVEHYVAPYEADAQLAYLYNQKLIDVVFTEDSDLILFGVKHLCMKLNTIDFDLDRIKENNEK